MKTSTLIDNVFLKLNVMANHGKDEEAKHILRKFAAAYMLLNPRDLWTYLYDWISEAVEFLKGRKITLSSALF